MDLTKLAGVIALGAGLFFVFLFPDISQHQPRGFSATGLLIGFALIAIGNKTIGVIA